MQKYMTDEPVANIVVTFFILEDMSKKISLHRADEDNDVGVGKPLKG